MVDNQMGMPAAAPAPEQMAIFDQMRQNISPKEFSDEMLASASQADPQAVAQFKQELDALDVPAEVLDALNNLVDEILANPSQYDQIRQKYMSQGIPEDILPEQFDPHFFAALNMAVDQMIGAPAGPQAFAKGGIAELKPIHKAIADYGRNGDTMLAHITPAEARMLKRRGGAGTTNPKTGLPEFFSLGGIFKSIGNAVKSFASSTVGRIVTTVALGMILGPAAGTLLGVAEGTAAAAALSGFVGGAGSALLAGGNLRDALKAGAVAGVTAGAGSAIAGAPLTGPATPAQLPPVVDLSTPAAAANTAAAAPGITPDALASSAAAPVPPPVTAGAEFPVGDPGAGFEPYSAANAQLPARMPTDLTNLPAANPADFGALPPQQPSMLDQAKDFYNKNISPSGIQEAGQKNAMDKVLAQFPGVTQEQVLNAPAGSVLAKAYSAAMPGMLATYGPMAAAGLGIMGLAGGFQKKDAGAGPITSSLMTPATERIRKEGSGKQYFVQGLPGVQYDAGGIPVPGGNLPLYTPPDYSGGYGMPASAKPAEGIMRLPTVYATPAGAMGSRTVAQPYNNADMYSNILYPRRYADGGDVAQKTPEQLAAEKKAADEAAAAAAAKLAADQKAARDAVAQQKAMRKAQGSGTMYANINAGLAARAPEINPMDTTDTGFGERNRQAQLAALQNTYGGMLQQQRTARDLQTGAMASGQLPTDISRYTGQDKAQLYMQLARQGMTDAQIRAAAENAYGMQTDSDWRTLQGLVDQDKQYNQMVTDAYKGIGREGVGLAPNQADAAGYNYWLKQLQTGAVSPDKFQGVFDTAAQQYIAQNPNDQVSKYVQGRQGTVRTTPVTPPPVTVRSPYPPGEMRIPEWETWDAQTKPDFSNSPGAQVGPPRTLTNTGGIAALAQGGYPRRTGQISGPGTEKSDSIPAMLSDGEFVMTAKAVRGAGNGNRRDGAKKMYKLMHQLERNAQRG